MLCALDDILFIYFNIFFRKNEIFWKINWKLFLSENLFRLLQILAVLTTKLTVFKFNNGLLEDISVRKGKKNMFFSRRVQMRDM